MNLNEITERLEEIREEFCPSTLKDLLAAIDDGYNDLCGCTICALSRDLLIFEINSLDLNTLASRGSIEPIEPEKKLLAAKRQRIWESQGFLMFP